MTFPDKIYSLALLSHKLAIRPGIPLVRQAWHQGKVEAFADVLRLIDPEDPRLDDLARMVEEIDRSR